MNNKIPAVEKTVHLLHSLCRGKATQAELSRALGISMSTTYRILNTLREYDWLRKEEDGYYALSSGLLPLLVHFRAELRKLEHAKKAIVRLAREHHLACKVSIRRDREQLTLYRAELPGPVALTGQPGSTFPLIEGSVGAALLCMESEENLRRLVQECDADIPEKSNPELLLRGVAEVREKGYALNLRKNRWNIAALSMPLYGEGGAVVEAAFTLIGTAADFSGSKLAKHVGILRQAIDECNIEQAPNEE